MVALLIAQIMEDVFELMIQSNFKDFPVDYGKLNVEESGLLPLAEKSG